MGIKLIDKINAEQTASLAGRGFPEFRIVESVRLDADEKLND